MTLSMAVVLFRGDEVDEAALVHALAVACAGFDVPRPRVTRIDLDGTGGWTAAFYHSGAKLEHDELDHVSELFEEDLSPGLLVREAAREPASPVYALVYTDQTILDDAYRFTDEGVVRHFVRETDDGAEWGIETFDDVEGELIEAEQGTKAFDEALRSKRGSTWLSNELRFPVVATLARALFEGGKAQEVRLYPGGSEAIERATRSLCETLKRTPGRGAFSLPDSIAGVATPEEARAFAHAYDWKDPGDPEDLFRELSIGKITGTLHFMREAELEAKSSDATWTRAASGGAFPIATVSAGGLGSSAVKSILALSPDRDRLVVVDPRGESQLAGPTFAELLHYLALGFRARTESEEDLIGALMLRAAVRVGTGGD